MELDSKHRRFACSQVTTQVVCLHCHISCPVPCCKQLDALCEAGVKYTQHHARVAMAHRRHLQQPAGMPPCLLLSSCLMVCASGKWIALCHMYGARIGLCQLITLQWHNCVLVCICAVVGSGPCRTSYAAGAACAGFFWVTLCCVSTHQQCMYEACRDGTAFDLSMLCFSSTILLLWLIVCTASMWQVWLLLDKQYIMVGALSMFETMVVVMWRDAISAAALLLAGAN
ncbi:hypothetical protein COO60DRAFT_996479 [Scenedesmus sp. NREL 46B-D3]|nr:hypothetical protein COO60DRAFT_996479 [Scenedesmus sp. NREL 46B-D3]